MRLDGGNRLNREALSARNSTRIPLRGQTHLEAQPAGQKRRAAREPGSHNPARIRSPVQIPERTEVGGDVLVEVSSQGTGSKRDRLGEESPGFLADEWLLSREIRGHEFPF